MLQNLLQEEFNPDRPDAVWCSGITYIVTDEGFCYLACIMDLYIEILGVILPSYSQNASPWQNACIESLHALIKCEWLYRFQIRDFHHVHKLVFEYIQAFYNTMRIHSHCDYLTPIEYRLRAA